MLATVIQFGAAAVRDFMVDQRLRDDAEHLAAGVEHGVGDDPHQPQPAAAIDEVDAALDHRPAEQRARRRRRPGRRPPPSRNRPRCGRCVTASPAPSNRRSGARHNAGSLRPPRSPRSTGSARALACLARAARKPAANRSPAPVVSTTWRDRRGGDRDALAMRNRGRALGAARDDQRVDLGGKLGQRAVGIGAPGQLEHFVLIGEQQVDPAAVDHRGKAFAAPGDAHAFAQREGDLAPRGMGDLDRLAASPRAAFRGPTNSLRDRGSRADAISASSSAATSSSWLAPGAGVHRPLAVGGDEDQAAPGRRPADQRRRVEPHARARACHARRSCPSWSSATWPMNAALPAHRGDPGHRIGRRPARHLARLAHRGIERVGLAGVSNCIDPLGRSCVVRNASSHDAMTSTMASPMATMSIVASAISAREILGFSGKGACRLTAHQTVVKLKQGCGQRQTRYPSPP